MTLRIAGAAGFWGDQPSVAKRLVERIEVDFLTLEYLAELTMSILARLRQKDPQAGYARDFLEVLQSLTPVLYLQPRLHVITNAGGVNPRSCAAAAGRILADSGSADLLIGTVLGDDLLDRIEELQGHGCRFENLDTGEPLALLKQPVVAANAYLGGQGISQCLDGAARVVVTGRVADASLTVGPAAYHYGWDWQDWTRLAGASVAGHVIECGAQATGGYSTRWENRDLAGIGYPIAQVDADGAALITKEPGSGGRVDRISVAEQLVYEIGDPQHYLTPDVDVDFTGIELTEEGPHRVRIGGAAGSPPPDSYKVSLAYHDGFMASGQLLVYGRDCRHKARQAAEIVFARLKQAGYQCARTHVELLGAGQAVPGLHPPPADLREVVLRMAVHDTNRAAVEQFTKELAPLITSGPAGLAGYASSRSSVRPVFSYWPTLVPKDFIETQIIVRKAKQWAALA